MRRLLIIILLFISSVAWAGSTSVVVGGVASAPAGLDCTGTLFCEDFEGTDTAWSAHDETLDCNGYDAADDYCDDETTVTRSGGGSEVLGIRGASSSSYLAEALSSSATQLYVEFWFRTTATGENNYALSITGSSDVTCFEMMINTSDD